MELSAEGQQILVNYGISPEEYQAWVTDGVVPAVLQEGNSAIEGAATMQEIQRFVQEKDAAAGIVEEYPEQAEQQGIGVAEEEAQEALADYAERVTSAATPEEAAMIASEAMADPNMSTGDRSYMASLLQTTTMNTMDLQQWMNSAGWDITVDGMDINSLMTEGYLAAVEHFTGPGGNLNSPHLPMGLRISPDEIPEGISREAYAATKFQKYIMGAPEEDRQIFLSEWAHEYEGGDYYREPLKMGRHDTDAYTVRELASALQVPLEQATRIIDIGGDHGLKPDEAVMIYRFGVEHQLINEYGIGSEVRTMREGAGSAGGILDRWFGALAPEIAGRAMRGAEPGQIEEAYDKYGDGTTRPQAQPDWLSEYERLGASGEHWETVSTNQMMGNFSRYVDEYQSYLPAMLATVDKELADKFYNDPYSTTQEEKRLAYEMVSDDPAMKQWIESSFLGSSQMAWLEGMGAGGPTIVPVDKEAVRDATRTIVSSWNLPGMSDAFVDSVANSFAAGQAGAAQRALGNPFQPEYAGPGQVSVRDTPQDKQAHAKKALRGTDEYQKFFKNKGDLSEEDYVGRFEQESAKLFGHEVDSAVRAGMLGGERKDVATHGIASGEFKESSTFQERLARLSNAFKGET